MEEYTSIAASSGGTSSQERPPGRNWTRRLTISLTILAWITIALVALWFLGLIAYPLLLVILSIIIAYVLYPLVKLLRRVMPNALAVLLAYLAVLIGLLLILYYVFWGAIAQLVTLMVGLQKNLPAIIERSQPMINTLQQAGISPQQFALSGEQLLKQALNVVHTLLPLAGSFFTFLISCIIITSLSVYFILDGKRTLDWLKNHAPLSRRTQVSFFLDTLNHIMGSYLRGQLTAAIITTAIVGVGLYIIGVPYAILLTVIVFIFEFVPQIGSYISSIIVICFAFATRGWETGLITAVFSGLVQGGLEGQVLQPRILGGAVGLHPIIALFALLVGAALFGLPGAIFAAPIVGIAQVFLLSAWRTWKQAHPEEFPEEEAPLPHVEKNYPAIEGT
ncbi:MAG TPA: AI-2E family transporter [Ktedonobacteraceae bacterium]|nr:AI-2E family transporter [Ktedonobacteraceae bacterium]